MKGKNTQRALPWLKPALPLSRGIRVRHPHEDLDSESELPSILPPAQAAVGNLPPLPSPSGGLQDAGVRPFAGT